MLTTHRVLAVALLLGAAFAASDLQAQNVYGRAYGSGYGFGLGAAPFFTGNFGYVRPSEELPYFAKFPPVYYSHIVPRPYGVSPFAAPPGIIPTEYMVQPLSQPEVIRNPYVDEPIVEPTIEEPKAMLEDLEEAAPTAPAKPKPQPQRKKKKN